MTQVQIVEPAVVLLRGSDLFRNVTFAALMFNRTSRKPAAGVALEPFEYCRCDWGREFICGFPSASVFTCRFAEAEFIETIRCGSRSEHHRFGISSVVIAGYSHISEA